MADLLSNPISNKTLKSMETDIDPHDEAYLEYMHFTDIIDSFKHYSKYVRAILGKKAKDFSLLLPKYKAMFPEYLERTKKCGELADRNQAFLSRIAASAEKTFRLDLRQKFAATSFAARRIGHVPSEYHMEKVVSTLKQCVRDWGREGAAERDMCYGPVLAELELLYPDKAARRHVRVLNPGCGLGRLMWEVANRGFSSQGNEFSYQMLITSHFFLNLCPENGQTIHPFVHETKNSVRFADRARAAAVPDVDPGRLAPGAEMSVVSGDFVEIYGDPAQRGAWDAVLSVFFVDTAHNAAQYLELFAWLLRPGGALLNFGPLLYHFADLGGEVSVEPDYEGLRACLAPVGFELIKEQMNMPSTYCLDTKSMARTHYDSFLWVCRKKADLAADKSDGEPFYGDRGFDAKARLGGLQ